MKEIITLDKANQPYGFPQLDGSGNLIITGSVEITGSLKQNGYEVKPYRVYTALLTQSGGNDIQNISSGAITQGITYQIDGADGASDFSNVGGPPIGTGDGTSFVATNSSIPNNYSSANLIYNTGAPVVTVLENTIGNIWFIYDDVGSYNTQGNFPSNKTTCIISNIGQVPGDDISVRANISTNSVYIVTTSVSFTGTSAYSDDILQTTPIEIRVYN